MPIFKYRCEECEETSTAIHMSGEHLLECKHCGKQGTLVRLLNKPYIAKKKESSSNTGDVTKKFIEENRKILEQQKKEIKEKTYDES